MASPGFGFKSKIACLPLLLGSVLFAAAHKKPHFEPNLGQADTRLSFLVRCAWGTAGISARSIQLFRRDDPSRPVWVQFEGASAAGPIRGSSPLGGLSHYAIGQDPSRWIWGVRRFGGVEVESLYPGVGLSYYITSTGSVEFDFNVAPHASTRQIRMAFADPLRLHETGELTAGPVRLREPKAWQVLADGKRQDVTVRYVPLGTKVAGLKLGSYDRTRPITIDPVIEFATYLGGSENEANTKIAIDSEGAIFVTGSTTSADFPATLPENSPLNRPQLLLFPDLYVSRLRSDGTSLDWSLFFGGARADVPLGIRLDDLGNVYVMGLTASVNFPVTPGAFRTFIHPSLSDTFVMKLDAKTGRLKASTYLHASVRQDLINNTRFAVDPAGGAYIAGHLGTLTAFTTTEGVPHPNPIVSAGQPGTFFAMRLNASLSAAVYATFLQFGVVNALEVDSAGNLVLGGRSAGCGQCGSAPFPAVNAIPDIDQKPFWPSQAYVAKLNPSGSAVVFATLIHGEDRSSMLSDLKVATDGTISLLGFGNGSKFPLVNPIPYGRPADTRAPEEPVPFLARIGPEGGRLLQSTLFYGPEFKGSPGLAFPADLKLAMMPDGRTCMLNLNSRDLKQTPGALGSTIDPSYSAATLMCLDGRDGSIATKTFLPEGAVYREMIPTPGNALLLSGIATAAFGTSITPNAYQTQFGGESPRIQGYPITSDSSDASSPSDPIGPLDAFLMHLSLATPQPKITGVNPGAMVQSSDSGTSSFEVYGSNLTYGLNTAWNGEPVPNQFINSQRLRLSIDSSAIRAGENRIQVTVPGGGDPAEAVVMVTNATPDRVTLAPNALQAGASETKLVVRADNLIADSILYWNGSPRNAQFISNGAASRGGRLELVLAAEELARPGTIRIAVSNPPPGGGRSTEAFFAILPPGGAPLTITQSYFEVHESMPLAATQILSGNGYTSTTKIFWDGLEIPAEYVSATSMRIQLPTSDLAVWGGHTVYAQDGALRSAPRQVFVARYFLGTGPSAYDPVSRLVWCMTIRPDYTYDLLGIDAKTGAIVNKLESIARVPFALIASADGNYVYFGDRKVGETEQPYAIRRVNTRTKAIDLEWTDPAILNSDFAMLPVAGSPETIAVVTGSRGVYIYDRNRRRPNGGVDSTLPAADAIVFVTPTRLYLNPVNGACWRWIEFDEQGPRPATRQCSSQMPADAVQDGNVLYFRDSRRSVAVSVPDVNRNIVGVAQVAVDPVGRRAYTASRGTFGPIGVTQYDMESKQHRTLVQAVSNFSLAPFAIYADGDGVVYAGGNLVFRIPSR